MMIDMFLACCISCLITTAHPRDRGGAMASKQAGAATIGYAEIATAAGAAP
jgi:hypothetical protein